MVPARKPTPAHMGNCDTFVHLVGVSHPSPAKAAEFRSIDLESTRQAVNAAVRTGIKNFVYISVAQPAPVMKAYIAARKEAEDIITHSGLNASILRPFYILGPGRRWPLLLKPFFALAEILPPTRAGAQRLSFRQHPAGVCCAHQFHREPARRCAHLVGHRDQGSERADRAPDRCCLIDYFEVSNNSPPTSDKASIATPRTIRPQ